MARPYTCCEGQPESTIMILPRLKAKILASGLLFLSWYQPPGPQHLLSVAQINVVVLMAHVFDLLLKKIGR